MPIIKTVIFLLFYVVIVSTVFQHSKQLTPLSVICFLIFRPLYSRISSTTAVFVALHFLLLTGFCEIQKNDGSSFYVKNQLAMSTS